MHDAQQPSHPVSSFAGPSFWPTGTGEMAGRVRDHDWSRTPLGSAKQWPQSLRTALNIVLALPSPATIFWGPAHVQIYNDAYIAVAGDRHPTLLGRPAAEGWPDAFGAVLAPLLDCARTGSATGLAAVPIHMDGRDAASEDRLFDTIWSPIRDEADAVAGVLQTLIEASDRFDAQMARRESETRNRLLIEGCTQAVWEADPEGVVVADSPSWRAYTGQTLDEWLGYGWVNAIHPDDRAYAERQWRAAVAAHGLVNADFRLQAPDGGWRWTNVRAAPVLDADGTIEKWAGMNIDIEVRKQAEAALREREERLRGFGEASSDVLWIRDAETFAWTYLTPAFEAIYGLPREEALAGNNFRNWVDLIVPEDRDHAVGAIRRVREGERVTFEYRIRRPVDGQVRCLRNTDFPIRDMDGRVTAIGGVGHDATEEKEAEDALREREEQLQVMVAELQHRTRNLIGVVGSVARQTMEQTGPTETFQTEFRDRLEALSRVQSLLSRAGDERVAIREVVDLELKALGAASFGDRVQVEGPEVALRKSTVQTLALAIHELATNARKYGALSNGHGVLTVRWTTHRADGEERRLFFEWVERGVEVSFADGAAVVQGGGYGRQLIEKSLPYSLKAKTTYELGSNGLTCTIDLPLGKPGARGRS